MLLCLLYYLVLCQGFYAYPLNKFLLILESVVVHYMYRLDSTENMKIM